MLGYVTSEGRGTSDLLLAEAARRLLEEGWPLAGVVQENVENPIRGRCDMDLHVLATDRMVRISQDLGPMARGCRLDPAGLEQAVGLVERALDGIGDAKPRLLVVNKFGKQEIEGRGFRPVIGRALAEDIPVLVAVNASNLDAFHSFSDGIGEAVAPSVDAILHWIHNAAVTKQS
jgi:hypothetical protein